MKLVGQVSSDAIQNIVIFYLFCLFFALAQNLNAQDIGDIGVVQSGDGELNVRSGPSTDYSVISVVTNGEELRVLEVDESWMRVQATQNRAGWVYSPLVVFPDDATEVSLAEGDSAYICNAGSDITNVRYGPSSEKYSVLTKLPNGHEVIVEDVVQNDGGYYYYEVSFTYPGEIEQSIGYVYHKVLSESCNTASLATASSDEEGQYTLRNGDCYVIAASRQTPLQAQEFLAEMDRWDDHFQDTRQVYLAENGWYAISIGTVPEDEFEDTWKLNLIRDSQWMLDDIYCSTGTKYVRRYNDTQIAQLVEGATEASETPSVSREEEDVVEPVDYTSIIEDLIAANPNADQTKIREAFDDFDGISFQPYGVEFSNIEPLSALTDIQELSISGEELSDLSALSELPKLRELRIFRASVSDIQPLSELTELEYLQFYNTQVTDLSPIQELSKLREFSLSYDTGERYNVDLSPLSKNTGLKELLLSKLIHPDLTVLNEFSELETLHLSGSDIQDIEPLRNLSKLEVLYMLGTNIEDISPLAGLNELVDVQIGQTLITDIGPLSGKERLENLSITGTDVVDISPLAGLPSLSGLDIKGTLVTDLSPISSLKNLDHLWLGGKIGSLHDSLGEISYETDLTPLSGSENLEYLALHYTGITDLSPIVELPNLQQIWFGVDVYSNLSVLDARDDIELSHSEAVQPYDF